MRILYTKLHVEPHVYCFVIFWQQLRPELGRNKPVQGIFPFLFSNVRDCRTSSLIKGRVLYKDIVKDSNSKAEI